MDLKSKIILIYGPTASGKSKFAVNLAKKINGEIINADSMQVYKELKILSARPYQKDYKKIRHHLYGFQNVKKKFSTGSWLKLANKNILDIKKRKKFKDFLEILKISLNLKNTKKLKQIIYQLIKKQKSILLKEKMQCLIF